MNGHNALWKDILPYQLNLIIHSNQGLVLFRKTQTLSRHKNLNKHNNKFFSNI